MTEEKKKKVLIAEDEEAIRGVLSDALSAAGFDVKLARDGQEAVMIAAEWSPDLILLDVLMPRMDGRAALKELRAAEATASIPVIFLTNLNELDAISDAMDAHVVGYIVKSDWSIGDVVEKVKKHLR